MGPATQEERNAPMIKEVTDLRVEIQGIIKKVQGKYNSRESALAVTKLQEARHWLGELKGSLGAELPPEYADKQ